MGFSTVSVSPSVLWTMYETEGAVVIMSRSNSLSSRSSIISMCKSPKKPQRKPKPKAVELSGSNVSAASFNLSFKRASLRSPNLLPSSG